ncbi:MAG: helix-turn-helix domain-containing protein [Acidimicrobiales bacterium]
MAQTTEEYERQLGAAVRAQRLRQRLTQIELAERANISLGSLRALEHGRNSTTATLIKVLRALGQTDWLATLSPPAPTFSPIEQLKKRRAEASDRRRVRRPAKVST